MIQRQMRSPLFPYTTLFRSRDDRTAVRGGRAGSRRIAAGLDAPGDPADAHAGDLREHRARDRKSTRLNSSHVEISYAVFCLKKKIKTTRNLPLPEADHPPNS